MRGFLDFFPGFPLVSAFCSGAVTWFPLVFLMVSIGSSFCSDAAAWPLCVFPMVSAGFRLLLGCSGVVSVCLSNGFRWFPASARTQRRGFCWFPQSFPLLSGFCSDAVAWFPLVFPMVSAGFRLRL